jgi:AraC-like DNA-binding protein
MTVAEHDFRKARFKSPRIVDKPWLEWFREGFRDHVFRAEVDTKADAPFQLDACVRQLPDLAIFTGESTPIHWRSSGQDERFGVVITLVGQHHFKSRRSEFSVGPGVALIGQAPDAIVTNTHCKQLGIEFSPRLLAPLLPDFAERSPVPLSTDTQAVRLLIGYLKMLDAEEVIETPEAQYLAAQHVHDLAALAIGTSRDAMFVANERGGRAARLAALKQDILAHLSDPNLSVANLAARHGLSPRHIHRLFEPEGMTYSEFVVAQRLARAHRMLTDPRNNILAIGTIAFNVGFGDLSYFNRTFRRKYGMTPSDVRALMRG